MEIMFDIKLSHEGFAEFAEGMNFTVSDGRKFVYINPSILYDNNFDLFVKDIIKTFLTEYLCAITCEVYGDGIKKIDEGFVIETQALCDTGDFKEFLINVGIESCPCEKTARKILRLIEDD